MAVASRCYLYGKFYFLPAKEIKRLTKKIATLSERQEYGGRLSVEFREKNLMDLVDALNTWVDENEQKDKHFKKWKKTSDYRSSAFLMISELL